MGTKIYITLEVDEKGRATITRFGDTPTSYIIKGKPDQVQKAIYKRLKQLLRPIFKKERS